MNTSATPVFFGRERELSILSQSFDSVKAGHGTVILIGGEAGVGKTSLIESFASKLEKGAVTVAKGYCLAEVSIPYFPFAEALENLLEARGDKHSAGIMRWLAGPEAGSRQPTSIRDQMFELIVGTLREESAKRPLLLFLDDLHWADSASLALLHYLARNTRDRRILVVGAYRTEELGDLAPGKPHPLLETMRLMSREGLLLKLELAGLETGIINEVTRSVISGAPKQVLQLVARESEGNPFYAVEYARFLVDSGALELISGVYRMKASQKNLQIPSSILDVIERRLSHLPDEERRLIDCASVIGEHFEAKTIAAVLKLDELSTTQTLARLSQDTRLILEVVDRFQFEHAKIKEAVYARLGHLVAAEMHRRVADALLKVDGLKRVQELAYHYHSAGIRDKTIEFGLLAGDQAKQQFAYAEAASCYSWVIEASEGHKEHDEQRASAFAKRAESLSLQGLHQQAISDCERALAISSTTSLRILALRVCAVSWRKMGHFTEALERINRAEAELGEEKLERLKLQEEKALILYRRGEYDAADAIWRKVSRGYLEMGGKREYAMAIYVAGESPHTKDPILVLHEALAIFEELGDLDNGAQTYFALGNEYFAKGETAHASKYYAKASEIAGKLGNFDALLWAQMYWAFALDAAGKYEEELQLSLRSVETAVLSETPYQETAVYSNLVRCYLRKNQQLEAEKAFARMNELYEKHSKDASLGLQGLVARTRGFRSACRGQWIEADQAYNTSIELLRRFSKTHNAETRLEYAGWLLKQSRKEEALRQLEATLAIYNQLGNELGIKKTEKMLKVIA